MMYVVNSLPVAVAAASSDSSSGDAGLFGLLFLLSGFVFYGVIYFAYRNSDKRYHYESSTDAKLHNLKVTDQPVRRLKGLRNAHMTGANNRAVHGAPSALPSGMLSQLIPQQVSRSISRRMFGSGSRNK